MDSSYVGKQSQEEATIKATKGCPQGRILFPLMCSLVIDDLFYELGSNGFEVVGYADDLFIMVRGQDIRAISVQMQIALDINTNLLNTNSSKTILVFMDI